MSKIGTRSRLSVGSRMTSKGQVTVPAEVRRMLKVKPGDRLVFREEDGVIVLESATAIVDRLYGMFSDLAQGKPPATIEEWDEAIAAGWANESFVPK